jgi:hypothetical protein
MNEHLWKALAHLYPDADPRRDYEIRDDADGRGPHIAAWRLPGEPPTEAQIAAAITAYDAAVTVRDADARQLRQRVRTLAGGAAGKLITDLTAAEVRALLAVLLWQAGALTPDGAVRPLDEWVR